MATNIATSSRRLAFTGPALILAAAWLAACSSEFNDCSAARECQDATGEAGAGGESPAEAGTAGSGGGVIGATDADADAGDSGQGAAGAAAEASGAGGEGGLPPLPESCSSAADCDDGKQCDGVEHCVDGKCEYGAPPCPNAEPEHCSITCTEGESGPSCGLAARDADQDGYQDSHCSVDPGDDCDDSPETGATVHPGASEICNGAIDDDCDGSDESTDEVLLTGNVQVLVPPSATTKRSEPAIAANGAGGFGVAWTDYRDQGAGVTSEIYYRALNADGTLGDERLVTSSTSWSDNRAPSVAFDGTYFGIAYRSAEVSTGSQYLRFIKVSPDGSTLTGLQSLAGKDTITIGGAPRLAWNPDQQGDYFDVYWPASASLKHTIVGDYSTDDVYDQSPTTFDVVPDGGFAVSYLDTGPYIDQYQTDFSIPFSYIPDSAWSSDVAIALNPAGGGAIGVTRDDPNGPLPHQMRLQSEYGSCRLPFADAIPVDIVFTKVGTAFLYWNPARTALYAQSVNGHVQCTKGPSALVATTDGVSIGSAALAVDDDDNLAVVWSSKDDASGEWSIVYRLFSPALCE